ncbi:hypothetical protein CP082626L3_0743B, partial [Chlamydia psittaci 08-2626_L3]
ATAEHPPSIAKRIMFSGSK